MHENQNHRKGPKRSIKISKFNGLYTISDQIMIVYDIIPKHIISLDMNSVDTILHVIIWYDVVSINIK